MRSDVAARVALRQLESLARGRYECSVKRDVHRIGLRRCLIELGHLGVRIGSDFYETSTGIISVRYGGRASIHDLTLVEDQRRRTFSHCGILSDQEAVKY